MATSILSVIPVRPCIKCGATERYKNGNCKSCSKATATARYAANTDKIKAKMAAWYATNKDRVKATSAAWRAANPDKERAMKAEWAAANQDKVRAINAAWRAANQDKKKASAAAWYAANADKVKADKAAQHAVNPDKNNARTKAWHATNKDRHKATMAAWRAANPEAQRINSHNKRARTRAAGGALSQGLSAKLFKLQKGKCPCCKQSLGDDFHLDHVIPLARGGLNVDSNMQLLRAVCNLNKSAKDPLLFMQSRGFLL